MATVTAKTEYGQVLGKTWHDYHGGQFYSFRGIPYAKSPIGELRFMPCQPPDPWKTTLDATKLGPSCPGVSETDFRTLIGSEENCLNLNVYTKEISTTAKKPVMVFIHGGGFHLGSNKSNLYGPHYFITQDIVLVVINYRLGVLGFLNLKDKSLGIPGNNSLKDQVFALKWIQRNIINFGGDPNNVTIFGESAGAASVHYLILSPLANGLFHRAIMQSGCAVNPWARGAPNALTIAKALKYEETDEKAILDKLRKEDVKNLVKGQSFKDSYLSSFVRPYGPVIEYPHEGAFITEDPIDLMKSGRYNKVPTIIGYNDMEGLFFGFFWKMTRCMQLARKIEDIPYTFNIKDEERKIVADKIKEFYFKNEEVNDDNIDCKYKLTTDTFFIHGIQRSVSWMRQHQNDVYVYRFSHEGPLNFMKHVSQAKYLKTFLATRVLSAYFSASFLKGFFKKCSDWVPMKEVKGVAHGDDLFYIFSSFVGLDIPIGSDEDKFVQRFVKLWTNFAAYGNPTPEVDLIFNNVVWNAIEKDGFGPVLNIGETLEIIKNPEEDRMAFWNELYHKYNP